MYETNRHDSRKVFYKSFAIVTKVLPYSKILLTQPAITCSKLELQTREQGVKYVQS